MGARRLVVSDLDGTLLGDPQAVARFGRWIGPRRSSYVLAYASGRHHPSIATAIEGEGLPEPDAVISAVGTEIHDADARPWAGWLEQLDEAPVEAARGLLRSFEWLTPQPTANQTRLKASYEIEGLTGSDLDAIDRALDSAGLEVRVIASGGSNLDIIPAAAGKGRAAGFIADAMGIPARDVLVFGDSGNDLDLLSSGFNGTIVANALPELQQAVSADVYRSPYLFADGVLDGIHHWSATVGAQPLDGVERRFG